MWRALIKLVEKWACCHKWETHQTSKTYENYYDKVPNLTVKIYGLPAALWEKNVGTGDKFTLNRWMEYNKECKESKELEEESAVQPPQPSTPKKQKEVKHKYGEYQHVRLTDSQFQKLLEDYTEAQVMSYIRKVDEYCQQHGKSYKDYNLTIRNWMSKDNVQKIGEKINPYSVYDEYDKNQDLPF